MLLSFWGAAEEFGGASEVLDRLSEAEAKRLETAEGSAERAIAERLVAKLRLASGDAAGALAAAEAAYRWWRREFDVLHPECATVRTMMGQALCQLDRVADAEALEREVVEEADRRGERIKEAATARANLAQVLALENRYVEAEPLYRRALEDLSDAPASRGVVRNNLSVLLSNTGRASEADAELDRAIDDLRGALGEDSHSTRSARLNLAIRRVTSGKGLNALAALGDTDKRMVASLGPDHPSALLAQGVRAMIDAALGRAKGRRDAQRVLDRLRELLGPAHHLVRHAEGLLLDVIEGFALCERDSDSDILIKMTKMAQRASERGDHERALLILESVVEGFDRPGTEEAALIALRLKIEALTRAGRIDEVHAELERARGLAQRLGDPAKIADVDATVAAFARTRNRSLEVALRERITAAQTVLRGEGPAEPNPAGVLGELNAVAEEAEQAQLWLTAAAALVVLGKVYLEIGMRPVATRYLEQARAFALRAGAQDVCAQVDALLA